MWSPQLEISSGHLHCYMDMYTCGHLVRTLLSTLPPAAFLSVPSSTTRAHINTFFKIALSKVAIQSWAVQGAPLARSAESNMGFMRSCRKRSTGLHPFGSCTGFPLAFKFSCTCEVLLCQLLSPAKWHPRTSNHAQSQAGAQVCVDIKLSRLQQSTPQQAT